MAIAMKIKLLILESDQEYVNRLVNALSNQYAGTFELFVYSSPEDALSCVKQTRINVFLASDEFTINTDNLPDYCAFAYLTTSAAYEMVKNESAIGKYQKLSGICKEIQILNSNHLSDVVIRSEGSARLVVFSGPAGGVGTSTLAAAYAVNLARNGAEVLYVNLEPTGDTNLYFTGNGKYTLENVFYELMSQKKNMQEKVLHMAQESEDGVSYFETPVHAAAFCDIGKEQINVLIKMLGTQSQYQYVILDMPYEISDFMISVMERADRFIMVSDGLESANHKIERAISVVKMKNEMYLNKILIAYNRFSSRFGKAIQNDELHQAQTVGKIEGASPRELIHAVSEKDVFKDYL